MARPSYNPEIAGQVDGYLARGTTYDDIVESKGSVKAAAHHISEYIEEMGGDAPDMNQLERYIRAQLVDIHVDENGNVIAN